ncbi:response regulator [Legionella spiritensis]|uniref:Two component sensor and regulator histidine kinase response regulator n=1 Tax=Legionella spiritensis TaxID=452 RepID=A0A0W0ZBD5_LEGSP|nr:response regulator [Legionella spiritensis]KTD66282.1 two component sensor and regulator histidine kinase response regulator [Legionella spiritensis]SNV48460.1 two component sensor and regulator, histidine kinase response regulator [Legionella spiritensis]
MRVLIVEDNTFNAFCLTRLLQEVHPHVQVTTVGDSISALSAIAQELPSLIIMDGDLGASDGLHCNGPALADLIWQNNPSLPMIAWSDSEGMRHAFARIYKLHKKPFNDMLCWPKIVAQERIRQSLMQLRLLSYQTKPVSTVSKSAEALHL